MHIGKASRTFRHIAHIIGRGGVEYIRGLFHDEGDNCEGAIGAGIYSIFAAAILSIIRVDLPRPVVTVLTSDIGLVGLEPARTAICMAKSNAVGIISAHVGAVLEPAIGLSIGIGRAIRCLGVFGITIYGPI